MRAPTHAHRGDEGVNMTPMIDIVFLLIIFFVVTMQIKEYEAPPEDVDLPMASTGEPMPRDEIRRVVVTVLPATADGPSEQIIVAGDVVSKEQLRDIIAQEADVAAASGDQKLEVRVRCDRRVPYRLVEPILVICASQNVWKVTFAVMGDD